MILLLFSSFFTYLVGAIPTGYWFAKYCFGVDVTQKGSGNIGATNVARALGSQKYFLPIFLVDATKAALSLWTVSNFLDYKGLLIATVALLIGNAYSIFLSFRGGKGVSTVFGALWVIAPWHVVLAFFSCWMGFYLGFRRSDISSLASAVMLVGYVLIFPASGNFRWFSVFIALWIIYRHWKNIKALMQK